MREEEVEQSWNDFLKSLCERDSDSVLKELPCPLLELLDKQCHVDASWKALFKPERGQVLKLYLSRIELFDLNAKMKAHQKWFVKAFGQDRYNHLKLLVRLKIISQEQKPKKGLLAV